MKGKWWFFEIVQTKLAGPGYNLQVYVRNVTDNGPEQKVIDLQTTGLPGTPKLSPPIPTLTPPTTNPANNFSGKVLAFMANQYREVNPASATPVCRGFTAISHYMLAGWAIDAGQRIGPASEIEGGSGTPIPLR